MKRQKTWLPTFEDLLRQRRWGNVVRLVVLRGMSDDLVHYICNEFDVPVNKVAQVIGNHGFIIG